MGREICCAICGDPLDREHPLSVYGRNPLTFRKAWMDYLCFEMALEELKCQRTGSNQYMNRLDEYLHEWIHIV